jgi:hypothetical protein
MPPELTPVDYDPFSKAPAHTEKQFSALMDRTFGAGKWRETSGYRSPAKEDELRAEGAGTVRPGDLSAHSIGSSDEPGARDVVVDGMSPYEVAEKLHASGARFKKLFPEGKAGDQGAHLHVETDFTPVLTPVDHDPFAEVKKHNPPPPPPPPKPTPLQKALGQIGESFADIPREVAKQTHEALEKSRRDIRQPFKDTHSIVGNVTEGVGRVGRYALDELGISSAPEVGALSSIIGRPVDTLTGGRIPRELTGNIASLAIPIAGELNAVRETNALAKAVGVSRGALKVNAKAAKSLPQSPGAIVKAANSLRETVRTRTPQEKAEELVAKRIQRDLGRAPTALEMLEHAERTPDKHMTLMDVGGAATKGLAGMVARSPKGEGGPNLQKFLQERSSGQGPRLEADVQRQIGAGSSRQTIESLQRAQREAATPLYTDAFEANPVVRSSVIDQITRSEQGAPAWREAQKRAKGWVVGTDKPIPDKYSLRTLDQMKQVFGDEISMAKRSGNNGRAALYQGLKSRLVDELDTLDRSGLYSKARKTFSDGAASREAVEFGRSALKMNAEDIADGLRHMSDGDKELARLGVAESLRAKIRSTDEGRNAATKLARNRALQDQLAPFFDSTKQLQKFIDSATAEDTMFRTENEVVKGSQTAARMAEDHTETARAVGHGYHIARNLVAGRPISAATRAGQAAYEAVRRPNPLVGEHVADILTQPLSSNTLARRLLERGAPRMAKGAPTNSLRSLPRTVGGAVPPAPISGTPQGQQ